MSAVGKWVSAIWGRFDKVNKKLIFQKVDYKFPRTLTKDLKDMQWPKKTLAVADKTSKVLDIWYKGFLSINKRKSVMGRHKIC